jgi:hypothetical protein
LTCLFTCDSPASFVSCAVAAVAVLRCVSVDLLMNARFALMATPLTSAACASDNVESEDSGCLLPNTHRIHDGKCYHI